MLKIWKMAADFQNVYRYNVCLCSSVVLADVLEHNCNPAGENELSFVVGTCVFFYLHDSGFQRASAWATSWEKRCKLIAGFPDEMWMLQQPNRWDCRLLQKNYFPSRPIKRLARQEVKPPSFLMTCTQTPAHWHPKVPIKWYGSIYFVSLVEKKLQFYLSRKNYRKFHSNGKRSLRLLYNVLTVLCLESPVLPFC